MLDSIEDAIKDIAVGKIVIVVDDEDRENEGDFVMAASCVTSEAVNFMAKEGRGLICTPLSRKIAEHLSLHPMVSDNTEAANCNFTISVDHKNTSTGISTADRAATVRALISADSVASDFKRPGHVFPLIARDGGVLVRAGHTEASCDLAHLAGFTQAGVICEIMKEDGTMARLPDLKKVKDKHGLRLISIRDLIKYRRNSEVFVEKVAEAPLPTQFGEFEMMIYKNILDGREHILLRKPYSGIPYVRVHSECMTGDVFRSQRCDCRGQLDIALELIGKVGGVVLYMRQEGRGIGLVNKIKAYNLQDMGNDTVEANEMLGFPADLRDYGIGAQILADIGLRKIRLLTNNPAKVVGLSGYGLEIVENCSIETSPSCRNHKYLKTKKDKLGHTLKNV